MLCGALVYALQRRAMTGHFVKKILLWKHRTWVSASDFLGSFIPLCNWGD